MTSGAKPLDTGREFFSALAAKIAATPDMTLAKMTPSEVISSAFMRQVDRSDLGNEEWEESPR
jgi:hypothetical protein